MAPYSNRSNNPSIAEIAGHVRPSIAFIVLIFGALIAFEIFNYSTTDHALADMLGDLDFAGIPWSTILALAFCGIDFAGIARLFTPEQGMDEPKEVWYLFAAWLMAATMNAVLTWWGVSIAVASQNIESRAVVDPQTMSNIVPVFVAVMVWLIRILIIGTLSMALDRYLNPHPIMAGQYIPRQQPMHPDRQPAMQPSRQQPLQAPASRPATLQSASSQTAQPRPSHRPSYAQAAQSQKPAMPPPVPMQDPFEDMDEEPIQPVRGARPEPSYHTLSMSARPKNLPQGETAENSAPRTGGGNSGPNRSRQF